MQVEVEVSLYPLGAFATQGNPTHPVHDFLEIFQRSGCTVETTPMSAVVTGESSRVFEALRLGYEKAGETTGCVMFAKACNLCPL